METLGDALSVVHLWHFRFHFLIIGKQEMDLKKIRMSADRAGPVKAQQDKQPNRPTAQLISRGTEKKKLLAEEARERRGRVDTPRTGDYRSTYVAVACGVVNITCRCR